MWACLTQRSCFCFFQLPLLWSEKNKLTCAWSLWYCAAFTSGGNNSIRRLEWIHTRWNFNHWESLWWFLLLHLFFIFFYTWLTQNHLLETCSCTEILTSRDIWSITPFPRSIQHVKLKTRCGDFNTPVAVWPMWQTCSVADWTEEPEQCSSVSLWWGTPF